MASNAFGEHFRITTWGESHGIAIGVVIDGCPAGIEIGVSQINNALSARAPGQKNTSPRKEPDIAMLYSGVHQGLTTGAPISIIIYNKAHDSSKYEAIKDIVRPGHANYTYHEKYGIFDYKGGGRASARETACRVAAAAVAEQILKKYEISVIAKLLSVGQHSLENNHINDILATEPYDSFGGLVECSVLNVPAGLGEPIYNKIESRLANAMLSIPASKGFEIGSGFRAAVMTGSEHNDLFQNDKTTITNNSGGTLGGISNGMPITFRVPFKPTSSIRKSQSTIKLDGSQATLDLPKGSKHDPCVAIRAVSVVKAMCILVLADLILANRLSRI